MPQNQLCGATPAPEFSHWKKGEDEDGGDGEDGEDGGYGEDGGDGEDENG